MRTVYVVGYQDPDKGLLFARKQGLPTTDLTKVREFARQSDAQDEARYLRDHGRGNERHVSYRLRGTKPIQPGLPWRVYAVGYECVAITEVTCD